MSMDLNLQDLQELAQETHPDLNTEEQQPQHKPLPKAEDVEKVILAKDEKADAVKAAPAANDRELLAKMQAESKTNMDLFYDTAQKSSDVPSDYKATEATEAAYTPSATNNNSHPVQESPAVNGERSFSINSSTNKSSNHQSQRGANYSNSMDKDFAPLKDLLDESFYSDDDSSEDEGMPDYKIGGYHPIHVGEILIDRYVIIQKLGWGHFSTVWLTKDLKYNSYVALKVQKSAQHYVEAAYDEVDILDQVAKNWKTKEWQVSISKYYEGDAHLLSRLDKFGVISESSHCTQLLNSFIHHGPNGKHFIMVFEILGVNFLEIIKRYEYKGVPLPLVRKLAKQCLIGLDYMHRMCQIIHTDFKPENVNICLRDEEIGEISKTGQLTTTKMGKNDHIKKMNMKVAGTLGNYLNQKINVKTGELVGGDNDKDMCASPNKSEFSEVDSECKSVSTNNEVYDKKLFEGLTAKQKKNLRKKLQRKKKKQERAEGESKSAMSEKTGSDKDDVDSELPKGEEIDDIDINIDQDSKKQDTSATPGGAQTVEEMKVEFEQLHNKRGRKLDDTLMVKICDMGNGCWTHHHFTPEIQTRQYRSPEVIIGADYNTSADIWSFACTIFEMVTGEFLFEPRKGNNYDKDDDHLAQMMELLGRMPKNLALSGKNSRKFFTNGGHLKRIKGLNYWPLKSVLNEKYYIKEDEAQQLADFLLPMLNWNHEKRASAQQMLNHPWLKMQDNYEFKLTKRQIESMQLKKEVNIKSKEDEDKEEREMNELVDSDPELYQADAEEKLPRMKRISQRERFRMEMQARAQPDQAPGLVSQNQETDSKIFSELFDETEVSLIDPDEERLLQIQWKERQAKIHNSFTGPYPLDPTEFNHTDKGENYQFSTVTK